MYPEDNDDICTICKNMVKQARDTLTSNITLVSYSIVLSLDKKYYNSKKFKLYN